MNKIISITIFKTEFRINLKLVLIWTVIFASLIVLNLSLFDSVKGQQQAVNELMKGLPPEFLKAFNVNSSSFSSVEGYFSGKNLSLYLLAFSVLAVYLGANSIGKEISSRTITFLASKPLSRMQIYLSKTLTTLALLFIADVITGVSSFLASRLFTSDHTASWRFFAALFVASWLMQVVFMGVGQLLGIWLSDTQGFLLGTGSVFIAWIVDIISALPGIPEFLKYLTPFHYVNAEYVHLYHALPWSHIAALIAIAAGFMALAAWSFHRKDFEA